MRPTQRQTAKKPRARQSIAYVQEEEANHALTAGRRLNNPRVAQDGAHPIPQLLDCWTVPRTAQAGVETRP